MNSLITVSWNLCVESAVQWDNGVASHYFPASSGRVLGPLPTALGCPKPWPALFPAQGHCRPLPGIGAGLHQWGKAFVQLSPSTLGGGLGMDTEGQGWHCLRTQHDSGSFSHQLAVDISVGGCQVETPVPGTQCTPTVEAAIPWGSPVHCGKGGWLLAPGWELLSWCVCGGLAGGEAGSR